MSWPEKPRQNSGLRSLIPLAVALLALEFPQIVAAQGPSAQDATPASAPLPPLEPLVAPYLDKMDEAVKRQLGDERTALDRLKNKGTDRAEWAAAYGRLGQLYLLYDLEQAAEPCLINAHRLAPRDFRWPYYLGAVYQNQRRLEEAEKLLVRALELRPDDPPALLRLGEVYLHQDRPTEARALIGRLRGLKPFAAAVAAGLGRAAAAQGELEQAVELFKSALAQKPQASSLHYHLALAYRDLGDIDRAREHMAVQGRAPVTFPDPLFRQLLDAIVGVNGHLLLGRKALREGAVEAAVEEFRQAVAAAPANAEARRELGESLARLGEIDEAIVHFRAALENDPDLHLARFHLARALVLQGRFAEALAESDRLTAVDSQNAAYQAQRANILKRLEGSSARASLTRIATRELERRIAQKGSEAALLHLFPQNLEAYYAVYKVPGDQEELARVIRTGQLVTARFMSDLYLAAGEIATEKGTARTFAEALRRALHRLLPSARSQERGLGEPGLGRDVIFFPEAPAADRLAVEIYDLEAIGDAWFPWVMLQSFAESLPAQNPPWDEGAVLELARATSTYALVMFRLAGERARESFAPHLRTSHLRSAVRDIEARRAARSSIEEDGTGAASESPGDESSGFFVDVTDESGVDFRHVSSDWISRFRRDAGILPTFSGGGVSAGAVDGDRWPDLIFCGGDGCAVYLNRGDGTFADRTPESGIRHPGEARMAVLADFDDDGLNDLFLTYARDTNRLYRNRGGGRFVDATAESGLEREGDISGPAVAVDIDADGRLDLYVGNFGNYLAGASPYIDRDAKNAQPNRLYRNLGNLRFRDITTAAGVGDTGWTQALSHVDFDRDGDQDLYVANDFGRNELYINRGDGTFDRGGAATGSDDPFHGMNVAFTDLNRDTHADIFITNIWAENPARGTLIETNTLLLSVSGDGGPGFLPATQGVLREVDSGWSWAALFFDRDHDGDDDLYCVNGLNGYFTFSQERRHPHRPELTYPYNYDRETNLFYEFTERGWTQSKTPSGAGLSDVNSRGLALLDFDLDGDLDLAVSTFHDRPRLLRNDSPPENHRLTLELVGDPSRGSHRAAIGAQVIARAEGLYVWRSVTAGEGYLSQSALPVELGLGAAKSVELEILWPGGEKQSFSNVAADQRLRIVQARSKLEELP